MYTFFPTVFEFVCAQSPYSMRGLLIGLVYFVTDGIFGAISALFLFSFAKGFSESRSSSPLLSCGSWYYLAATLVAVLGCVVYLMTAWWYRKRKRGDHEFVNERAILESYFESVVEQPNGI